MVTTMLDLFKDPFFIGIDKDIARFRQASEVAAKQSYPPYDIIEQWDDDYILKLAAAGFSKEDLQITLKDGTLVITGEKTEEDRSSYIHKGIAMRNFTRTFALGEYMEVVSAEMENGVLIVNIKREIPEEKKPKQITIK
jgi:molecular chaperone IbpA